MKIVNDEPPTLPDTYSVELREIFNKLLQKKAENRPNTQEILNSDFAKKIIQNFIKTNGKLEDNVYEEEIPIKKLNIHKAKELRNS